MNKFYIQRIVSVALSVVASVLAVAVVGYAATTLSTNISTGGTLTVTGAITGSGAVAFDGTAATTTISGGLVVDTTTLVVDFSSSNVGIGLTTPAYKLDVTGTAHVTGTVTLDGVLTAVGNVGVASTSPGAVLGVHGNTILGSENASTVNFRAGVLNFTSTATTTITTNTAGLGFNINSGDLVLDSASNKLYIGTSTPLRGNLSVTGSGTTTLVIDTTTAAAEGSAGSCIELKAVGGFIMHMFATSTDEGYARLERGSCTTTVNE